MQQKGEKLSAISKVVKKESKAAKIIGLTVLNSIVLRYALPCFFSAFTIF